jgi:hypothetical protein
MRSFLIAFLCLLSLEVSGAFADSWEAPRPQTLESAARKYAFKVLPPGNGELLGRAEGVLAQRDKKGDGPEVWREKLVNIPHQVFVADTGKHIVTVDTYARLGFDHSLVLYGDKGKVLADYRLEDLLTGREIEQKVERTVSSRWWATSTKFAFTPNGRQFSIALKWGRTIILDLETGKISPPVEASRPGQGKNPYHGSGEANSYQVIAGEDKAPPAEIWSAKALNALLAELQDLQSRGFTGARVELDQELLGRLNWARGDAGHLGLLRKAGRLKWPESFAAVDFKPDCTRIDAALLTALAQAKKGKVEKTVIAELDSARKRLQEQLVKQVGDIAPHQYIEAKRFLNQLDDTVKALGQPGVDEYLKAMDEVASHGKSVAELVKFMTQKKLRFGPALAGDEAPYTAIYQALVAYRNRQPEAPKPATKQGK